MSWITHCPSCDRPVEVQEGSEAVACPHCRTAFQPERLETQVGQAVPAAPPSKAASDPLLGAHLGPWRLVRLIGRGGMGRVYEATDRLSGKRRVALKILSGDLAADPAFVKRFHREAKVLTSLEHPHVVEILDRGEHDGQLWFAMEYVRGENLRHRIAKGPLDPAEAVRIAGEIAAALGYAHARGVVHRDLKPENVLLDEDGRVHLVDFGLSRLPSEDGPDATTLLTRTDVILGTYEYMAPEQRRGEKDLDGRADIYALGVILYEMLTGTLPLGRFEPPSRMQSSVPEALDPVVNRALAPHRDQRFPDADAFRDTLQGAWKARSKRPSGKRPKRKPDPEGTRALTEEEVADIRPFLRHVDVTVAIDRVLGILMLLAFVGFLGVRNVFDEILWLRPAGVVFLIGGILLLRQGGKLSRMAEGAREGQITTSVLLLLLVPLGTVIGLYGLWVFTSDRARLAFRAGRKSLEGPKPVVARRIVDVVRPVPPGPAPAWMHLVVLFSLIWGAYVATVVLDHGDPAAIQEALKVSLFGVLLAGASLLLIARSRTPRRGKGMAIFALVVFLTCALALLRTGTRSRPSVRTSFGFGALPAHGRVVPTPPPSLPSHLEPIR